MTKLLSETRTIAVIPCYNEEKVIGDLVGEVRKHVSKVIVVDNGSRDNTSLSAREAGADVVRCLIPGVGAATRRGVMEALTEGADIVVTLDGDGQHRPGDIPRLLEPVLLGGYGAAVGCRDTDGMPRYRQVGNAIIALICCAGADWRYRMPDVQCGFRAIRRDFVEYVVTTEDGFGCITETLIKLRKAGCRIATVPVSCVYHASLSDNSTMNPIKHGLLAAAKTARWRLWELTGW